MFGMIYPSTITGYVGVNGSGKTLSAIAFALRDLARTGRPLVTNVEGLGVDHFHVEDVSELPALFETLRSRPDVYEEWPRLTPGTCNVVLDEAGAMFAARDTGRNKAFEKTVQQLRKYDARLLWTAPAFARADKILREVTFTAVKCRPLRQKRIPGKAWPSTRLILQKSFDVSSLDSSGMSINRNAKAKSFGIIRTGRWEHSFDSFHVAGRPATPALHALSGEPAEHTA
jgi:hypothetical protein